MPTTMRPAGARRNSMRVRQMAPPHQRIRRSSYRAFSKVAAGKTVNNRLAFQSRLVPPGINRVTRNDGRLVDVKLHRTPVTGD